MISKRIYYCWFGKKPLPKLAKKCIESWKRFCPDYELVLINEDNFDVEECDYVKEAYKAEKWAFVSDYARFKLLYEQGGIYFDTDVELIKGIDDIVSNGAFMGLETEQLINPGLGIGAPAGIKIYEDVLKDYRKSHFIKEDGSFDETTVCERVTRIFASYGWKPYASDVVLVGDVYIYPVEYFNPKDMESGLNNITGNTVSIHHFMASWCKRSERVRDKIYKFIYRTFGKKAADTMRGIFGKKKN